HFLCVTSSYTRAPHSHVSLYESYILPKRVFSPTLDCMLHLGFRQINIPDTPRKNMCTRDANKGAPLPLAVFANMIKWLVAFSAKENSEFGHILNAISFIDIA